MCASSRMVVKRKGAERSAVLSCTLLAYDQRFELGATLAEAARPVALNHPHCAKFSHTSWFRSRSIASAQARRSGMNFSISQ